MTCNHCGKETTILRTCQQCSIILAQQWANGREWLAAYREGLTMKCKHETTRTYDVQAIAGPMRMLQCLKCKAILARTPATTSEHVQHMQRLAASDGKEAGKAKRCTHNGSYLGFGDHSEFCAQCHVKAMYRVLDEVPIPESWSET